MTIIGTVINSIPITSRVPSVKLEIILAVMSTDTIIARVKPPNIKDITTPIINKINVAKILCLSKMAITS